MIPNQDALALITRNITQHFEARYSMGDLVMFGDNQILTQFYSDIPGLAASSLSTTIGAMIEAISNVTKEPCYHYHHEIFNNRSGAQRRHVIWHDSLRDYGNVESLARHVSIVIAENTDKPVDPYQAIEIINSSDATRRRVGRNLGANAVWDMLGMVHADPYHINPTVNISSDGERFLITHNPNWEKELAYRQRAMDWSYMMAKRRKIAKKQKTVSVTEEAENPARTKFTDADPVEA